MNMAEILDTFPARVRGLQDIYQPAHLALVNWGHWSRDRYQIGPVEVVSPRAMWDQIPEDEREAWGEQEAPEDSTAPAKPETPREAYDERRGSELDARINTTLLTEDHKRALVVAYVRRIHESMYPQYAGCGHDAFCERLEHCLRFVSRFI